MLLLRSGKLPATTVPLGSGASMQVRPATSFEVDMVRAESRISVLGLAALQEGAAEAAAILGEDFRDADFTRPAWIEAASRRLSLVRLAVLCSDDWIGVVDAAGAPLPLDAAAVAVLLRDPQIAAKVEGAIEANVHLEWSEKNASAASPNGAAAAGEPTAPNVPAPASPAPTGFADEAASAAPNSSTSH